MKITIEFIPHLEQRYNTCGDWIFDQDGDLHIRISDTGNEKWNSCLALHELVEALGCKAHKISTEEVDAFDLGWVPFESFEEPGEDPRAPYFLEHGEAMAHEEQLFDFLSDGSNQFDWKDYEAKLTSFEAEYKEHCK